MRLLVFAALALAACSDGYTCGKGDEGCVCKSDGDCDLDLRCLNGRCFDVPEVKRVFVTSVTFPGNFGGVDAADGECNYLARTAKVGGKWIAWLSSSDKAAADRIHDESPWYLMDHRTVAFATAAQLRTGSSVVITKNEYTGVVAPEDQVWTGTTSTGEAADACGDWSSVDATGTAGSLTAPSLWSDAQSSSSCAAVNHLYCFEQ